MTFRRPVSESPDWRVRMGLEDAAHPWIARTAHSLFGLFESAWLRRVWDWACVSRQR